MNMSIFCRCAGADRFFGVDAGTAPITEFFSPENIGRIVSSGRTTCCL